MVYALKDWDTNIETRPAWQSGSINVFGLDVGRQLEYTFSIIKWMRASIRNALSSSDDEQGMFIQMVGFLLAVDGRTKVGPSKRKLLRRLHKIRSADIEGKAPHPCSILSNLTIIHY
jgi:hypothetical protein